MILSRILCNNVISTQVKPLLNVARAEEEMKEREEEVNNYVVLRCMKNYGRLSVSLCTDFELAESEN